MRLPHTLALSGLIIVLGSWSRVDAQQIEPKSYEQLVSRLNAVESQLWDRQQAANQSSCSHNSGCNNCGVRGGFFVTYENVWAKPFFSHDGAYQVFDAIPNIDESVRIVDFDPGFESTPRVELGYIVPGSGLGMRARYWQFTNSSSVLAADPGQGRIEVGLHDDPDIEVSTADDEYLSASQRIKLDVLDLEGMKRRNTRHGEVTVSGGLRYVRLDQKYLAILADINSGVVDDILTSKQFFEGIGPTIAVEGVRNLHWSGWSVYGNARGSLLLGDSGLEQARIDPQSVNPIRDFVTTSNDADLQFIAEMQGGLQYEQCVCKGSLLFGRLGCEFQYWPSGGSPAYQTGEDSNGTSDPRDVDMGLLGLSASIGLKH